jgi:hypothetical protein
MMTLNGVSLAALGFTLRERVFPPLAAAEPVVVPLSGRRGGVRVGGTVPAGLLTVRGSFSGTSSSHAAALAARDALAALVCTDAPLVIRFDDLTDREWLGHANPRTILQMIDPQWISRRGTFTMEFSLPDPVARAQTEKSTVLANNVHGLVSLGNLRAPIRAEVLNGATAPITAVQVRVFRNDSAAVSTDLVWTGTLAVGKKLVINAEDETVMNDGVSQFANTTAASSFPWVYPGFAIFAFNVTGGPATSLTAYTRERWG